MNPATMMRPISDRAQPSVASRSPDAPYFPEGGVAAPPFMIVNPLSHGPQSFPGNGSPNELVGPATADWVKLKDSDEQGVGVPAFKRWPRQFHSEAYNHGGLSVMPLPDTVGPVAFDIVNRPSKAGWSVPKNSEQYEQSIASAGMGTGVANLKDPSSVAYAIGWGSMGT
jgi:hypothetical protein